MAMSAKAEEQNSRPHIRKCADENFVPRLSPTSPCFIVFSFRALKVWIANDIKIIDTHAATNGGWQLLAIRLSPPRHVRRSLELSLGNAGTIATKVGVVFQRLPGQGIMVITNSEKAAEAQDGV